jgi:F0F1-type ATP synthase epsilon subunit
MKLTIYSSTQTQEYDIHYLEVETSAGNFVILEGHAPLVLVLKPLQPLIFSRTTSPESHEKQQLPHGGLLKVTRTDITLIINE